MKVALNWQRKCEHDLRGIANALFYITRSGIQWRNMPNQFPAWTIVYYYFRRWKQDGTFETLNLYLGQLERYLSDKEVDPSLVCVDSQSIRSFPFVNRQRGLDPFKKSTAANGMWWWTFWA